MISLKPVVEMLSFAGEHPWETANFNKGFFLPISEHLSLPEIGAVMALLMAYHRKESLADVVAAEVLVLPGGVGVYADEELIAFPGCCCGLESWRGWESFFDTGETPWCGHDPESELTKKANSVTILHINGNTKKEVDLSFQEYRRNLITIEKSLQGFVFALEAWGYAVGFSDPRALAVKFNECFDIRAKW
ncbi:MAG: hypothetical protein QM758_01820 [Armatimonas sp.]